MKNSLPSIVVPFGKKEAHVAFDAGAVSSDAGALLVAKIEERMGLVRRLEAALPEARRTAGTKHRSGDMLRQRIIGIAQGYEDCNDWDTLRGDPVFGMLGSLASQPTLSRFENRVGPRALYEMSHVFLSLFAERHSQRAPKRIVIDFDATDDPAHGQQEFEFYHGYYECHCFLPLLCFASVDGGDQELIGAILRPGNKHAGHKSAAVLGRILAVLTDAFPDTEFVFRGDAAFALPEVYDLCEAFGITYVLSLPKNERLLARAEPALKKARKLHFRSGQKERVFTSFSHAAATWPRSRRVVLKAEVSAYGDNPRFVVTNRKEDAQSVYELYIQRGDVENRIKEMKLDLFSGRTSCHRFLANQFRLILHAAAYLLLQSVRALLSGSEFARAQAGTIRTKLLKVGAVVRATTRRVWLHLGSAYTYQKTWLFLLQLVT